MQLEKYLNRLAQVDYLIRAKATGTPKAFAEKLEVSERHLYFIMEWLRQKEVPIAYCEKKQSYYYTKEGNFEVRCAFKEASQKN